MTEVQFVAELPPHGRQLPQLVEFVTELKRHPLAWAIFPGQEFMSTAYRRSMASRINIQNKMTNRPPAPLRGDFEAAVRGGVIHVRYVGKKK